jgi:23S rRNA pseudouridine2605 synthase
MAASGVGSRRACEEIIAQGRVEVDGQVVTRPGTQVDPETQVVRCDGSTLRTEPPLYYLLNKPRGAICSHMSKPGTRRAVDYAPARGRDRRLFTIGRLDVDSEGALILTNDGELCHLLTHPRFGVRKTYLVEVEGSPDDATIEKMRKGVWLAEGRTGPVEVRLLHRGRQKTALELTLQEGKRREIRRLCARYGHEVRRLVRVAIGAVRLGQLAPGETRILDAAELAALRETAEVVIRLGGGPGPGRTRSPRSPRPPRPQRRRGGRGGRDAG